MRILVIEDDEETLNYISKGLLQAGHRVRQRRHRP